MKLKVWITKYALTTGIKEVAGEISENCPSMFCDNGSPYPQYFHGEGRDWHRTLEGAKAKAEEMRVAKIASLQKQIKRLEKLQFEP